MSVSFSKHTEEPEPKQPPTHLLQGQLGTEQAQQLVCWQVVRSHPGLVQEAKKAIYKLSFFIAFGSIFQKQSDTSCLSVY